MGWAEDDWERLTEYVAPRRAEVEQLLSPLGRVASIELLRGGKANTNYVAILDDGQRFVVRIYERDASAQRREALIIDRVAPLVPVPELLLEGELGDYRASVFSFVSGVHPTVRLTDATVADAARLGESFGQTLAALQELRFERPGLLDGELGYARTFDSVADSFTDLIGWSLREGRARKRLPAEVRAALRQKLDRAAERLEPLDARIRLCHGDYKFSNVLVEPDATGVTAVLDWEFACAFTPMLDIAILMRHRETFPAAFVDGFATAYRAAAWLPDDWKTLTRIVDLMNLVGFLNASGERPRLFADVVGRIEQTLPLLDHASAR